MNVEVNVLIDGPINFYETVICLGQHYTNLWDSKLVLTFLEACVFFYAPSLTLTLWTLPLLSSSRLSPFSHLDPLSASLPANPYSPKYLWCQFRNMGTKSNKRHKLTIEIMRTCSCPARTCSLRTINLVSWTIPLVCFACRKRRPLVQTQDVTNSLFIAPNTNPFCTYRTSY